MALANGICRGGEAYGSWIRCTEAGGPIRVLPEMCFVLTGRGRDVRVVDLVPSYRSPLYELDAMPLLLVLRSNTGAVALGRRGYQVGGGTLSVGRVGLGFGLPG